MSSGAVPEMDHPRHNQAHIDRLRLRRSLVVFCLGLLVTGCSRAPSPATARPPTGPAPARLPAATPSPTFESPCDPDARFLEDLTVPDGSQVLPGELVDKQWSMENTGACDWGAGYRLQPIGDNPFVGERADQLYPARAGEPAMWRVQFEAPSEPGEYIGEWQATTPTGERFGDSVFLLLIVSEP